MSENQSTKPDAVRRWIGKVKNIVNKYGTSQKIYLDAINSVNQDGTPNKFYKGALIWIDLETGKQYQVKQLSLHVPKDGMKPDQVQKGFVCNVTLNLADDYEVTEIG